MTNSIQGSECQQSSISPASCCDFPVPRPPPSPPSHSRFLKNASNPTSSTVSHTHSTLYYIGWIIGLYLASLMLYNIKQNSDNFLSNFFDTFFMVLWFHSPKLWQIAWHSTYSKLQIWWSTNIKCGLLLPESRQCPPAKFAAVTPTCCSTSGRDSEDGLWTRSLWAEDPL